MSALWPASWAPLLGALSGALLGALGGTLHLAVTWQRARALCTGRSRLALLLLPVAFAGPAAAVLLAALCSKLAACCTLPGLLAARGWLLPRLGGRDGQ